jgi:predicted metal-dependent phosphoesterase TrpH
MRVDLHLHTWVSDGDVSPGEVSRRAVAAGLDVISITDHDTAEGVADAQREAASLPLVVVPGIEISTRTGDQELHILGYWIDPSSDPIQRHQRQAATRRLTRMEAMLERMRELGVELTIADVEKAAGPSARTLGRPHLARALFAGGFTRFYSEAFSRYIGDGGPAFVGEGFPTPEAAINTIHEAGGVAVLAHPPLPWVQHSLESLVGWGLDGIECFRPGLDQFQIRLLEDLGDSHDLFPTGGSDWHGPQRFKLGEFAVPAQQVRELLALGGIPL